MIRPSLALLILCLACALAHGQSFARRDGSSEIIEDATADQVVASQAILLLKRLDDHVIIYRSLGEFEDGRKLARVTFETFQHDLEEVRAEVTDLVSRLPDGPLKSEIRNALASFCDGGYWWEKVHQQRRVINASELRSAETDTTSDLFFRANLTYTVAIHWRQANKYLQRAIREVAKLS